MLEQRGVDVMIVGRGGGSIEDLWAFNEEEVARAIFECEVPVISAVGHETDTTIADYVADLRAPTPSAAAELAVYDYYQMENVLAEFDLRFRRLMQQKIQWERLRLKEYQTKLSYMHPRNQLRDHQQRVVEYEERLRGLMENQVKDARHRLAIYLEKMKGLSPLEKLNQGYAYVQDEEKNAVKSIRQVKQGERITIYVTDGTVTANVEKVRKEKHGR